MKMRKFALALFFGLIVGHSHAQQFNYAPVASGDGTHRTLEGDQSAVIEQSQPFALSSEKSITEAFRLKLQKNYGKLPLSFEATRGQPDNRALFLSRGNGYSLFLNSTEAVLNLRSQAHSDPSSLNTVSGPLKSPKLRTAVL